MSDLTAFLLARIAEDEALARGSAAAGPWRYDPRKVNSVSREESVFAGPRGAMAITIASTGPMDDAQSMRDARHIARHDPARVLRECEAKRRIVELHEVHSEVERYGPSAGATNYWCDECDHDRDYGHIGGPKEGCPTLRHLAEVYNKHPDYREEWKP